ncbi:MAG: 2-keto-4-pentenoate hydratase [Rubricella sp.]
MDIDAIARHIVRDRAEGAPFIDFPIKTLHEGYAIQDLVTILSGRVGGYKIGWNSPALMERYHVTQPAGARIMAEAIRADGAEIAEDDHTSLVFEPEIAAVIGKDIGARAGDWTPEAVIAHVERFVPAFEVLDRREGGESRHAPSIIAGNVFNAGLVLGTGGAAPGADLHAMARLVVGGEEMLHAHDTAPQPPAEALAFIANLFTGRGDVIRAGQIVMCGTHAGLVSVPAGQEAYFEIEGLGSVRLRVV